MSEVSLLVSAISSAKAVNENIKHLHVAWLFPGDWSLRESVLKENPDRSHSSYDLASSSHTASFPQTTLIGTFTSLCLGSSNNSHKYRLVFFWLRRKEKLILWNGFQGSSEAMSNVLGLNWDKGIMCVFSV